MAKYSVETSNGKCVMVTGRSETHARERIEKYITEKGYAITVVSVRKVTGR